MITKVRKVFGFKVSTQEKGENRPFQRLLWLAFYQTRMTSQANNGMK
jgi:hypothetical protein